MRPEQLVEPCDVFKVSEWKWNVDKGSPWWRRAYFRHIFLRFLNFSFGFMKVPTPKGAKVTADEKGRVTTTYFWFEDVAILDDEDKADAACLNEHTGYKRMRFGQIAPSESAQYSGTVFPRKKDPKKWANPKLSLIIKDRVKEGREQQVLSQALARLNQVLDQ